MATLNDIVDEQTRIAAKLQELNDNPETTEDDDGNLRDTLVARWKELEPQRVKLTSAMEDLRMISRAASNPANTENGDGGGNGRVARTWDGRGPEFMRKMDPFADLDQVSRYLVPQSEMVSRAMTAVEIHDKRGLLPEQRGEEATRKAQLPSIARHMLLTGTDEYLEAFRTYLNDPEGAGQVARASLTTATAQAGYLLPYVLDTQIVLTNSGSTNPYRRIARVETTTSNAWQGVNSAGVTSSWLNESAMAAEAGTAVGQIQIIPQKAAAWVTGSFEVMSDTDYASQLPGLLADEKNIREENAFALGTGGTTGPNTGMPLGILLGLSATQRVTASGGTGVGAFGGGAGTGLNDVYNLNAALGPRFRLGDNVAWIANITTINRIRGLDQYGGGGFWANLNADVPDRLLNKPIYESPSLTSAGVGGAGSTALASGVAVFGDFSKFIIVDRIGSTMLFDPMVKTQATGDAPSGRQGWFYFWRVGSGVAAQNAFRWIGNI